MDHISKLGITAPKPTQDSDKNGTKDATPEPENLAKANQVVIKKFDEGFKLVYDPSVKDVRSFIICCIINNVQLTPASLKEFLQFQTKLHDGVCKKRELSTIATHDLDLIPSKSIRYAAKHKDDIKIQPLGRHIVITANEYYNKLKSEAEAIRKEKKRSQFTGVYKFLHFLEGVDQFPFLETETGTATLSLPPLTNSEVTKLSTNTKRILIEVTSNSNAAICNLVMIQLLTKALEMGMSSSNNEKLLEIEQVRIQNIDGSLKTIFPSKVDLIELENDSTQITRP